MDGRNYFQSKVPCLHFRLYDTASAPWLISLDAFHGGKAPDGYISEIVCSRAVVDDFGDLRIVRGWM
jgi:hypothetical protein